MSHFTVLVIGQNPEAQLAPFQENNMGDAPKEYLKYKVYDKNGEEHWFNSIEEFRQANIEVDDGEEGYWDNPNKKWDWYQLGGRWTGFFKTKVGVLATVGEPGVMTAEPKEGYADQLLKRDIDFEAMRNEAEIKAAEKYDFAMSVIGHLPANKSWDEMTASSENIKDIREAYWKQDRCVAWEKAKEKDFKKWPLGFNSSPDDFLMSKDQYIKSARDGAIATFAVIKDGKWYERGEMGWWAIVSNEKDESQWNSEFSLLIDSLPDDTLFSVYDCHI